MIRYPRSVCKFTTKLNCYGLSLRAQQCRGPVGAFGTVQTTSLAHSIASPLRLARFFGVERFTLTYDPREIARELEEVEDRLKDSDKESFGMYRGRESIYWKMRDEAPSKNRRARVNYNVAMAELKRLLYKRHALQNGRQNLNEFDQKALAKTFLKGDSKITMPFKHGQNIILEMYRYNKSFLLEKYQTEYNAYVERKRFIEENTAKKYKARQIVLEARRQADEEALNDLE